MSWRAKLPKDEHGYAGPIIFWGYEYRAEIRKAWIDGDPAVELTLTPVRAAPAYKLPFVDETVDAGIPPG